MSKITYIFFVTTFTSHCSIFINLHCAFAIVCTFVACCTFNYTSMNGRSSCVTMFSSLVSFCIIYASTKWCSLASSSFDFSMHTGSIDVALGHVYFLTRQHHLLLHKNSTVDVPIVFMSWIIICANNIFTLYTFPSTHSKDDDECGNNLTTND